MNINIDNWFIKYLFWLYRWDLDGDEGTTIPPASLCKYFWYAVWGIVCFPFTIIFYWRKIDFIARTLMPLIYVIILCTSAFTMPYPDLLFKKDLFTILWDLNFYGFMTFGIIAIVFTIVFYIVFTVDNYFIHKSDGIIATYAKSVKQKICPLINYKKNESLPK